MNTESIRELTSHLEFSSETVVFNPQFTRPVVNDSLNESLDSKLKIAGGEQNVSPDVFMHAGVHLKECLNIFSVNPTLLTASVVDVGHIVITQEGSKVLRVPDVLIFSQYSKL